MSYNQHTRIPVQGENFCAWGEVIYEKPLTPEQLQNSVLFPSRQNPDIKEHIAIQTEIVGKWERQHHISDEQCFTWLNSDTETYVLKESISIEQLNERSLLVEEYTWFIRKNPTKLIAPESLIN